MIASQIHELKIVILKVIKKLNKKKNEIKKYTRHVQRVCNREFKNSCSYIYRCIYTIDYINKTCIQFCLPLFLGLFSPNTKFYDYEFTILHQKIL